MTIDPNELVSEKETAKLIRQRPATLTAWRHEKRGPPYVKVGRRVLYRRVDIATWLGAQRRDPEGRVHEKFCNAVAGSMRRGGVSRPE